MPHDEDLAGRVRELLAGRTTTEQRMFGGRAFLLAGRMAVAVSGRGGLMVRVDPTQRDALVREPGAAVMEMRGRPMAGWLLVEGPVLDDDAALRTWVERGVGVAQSLPARG